MPRWIHDRAEHILARNPDTRESTAWAIATQQSHAKGKSPKGYGTKQGRREAKEKYDAPKRSYEGSANPGKLESPKMGSVFSPVKVAFDAQGALHGLRVAGLPALGGVLGAAAAGGLGMDPMTGEVIGASLGAAPEVIRALRKRSVPGVKTAGGVARLLRSGKLLPESVIAPQIRAGEQRLAQQVGARLSPRAHAMLAETPLGRAGTPTSTVAQLTGTSDMDAQRALMSIWDKTTPVHASKAASVSSYYFMLEALTKSAMLSPAQRLKQTQEVGEVGETEPKDIPKLTTFKPPGMKLAFTESEFSGGLGPSRPFIMRNFAFQSSLPGNPNKLAGPDPEEETGEPERYPDKEEKKASLWKAAHFACSAVAAWEQRQST